MLQEGGEITLIQKKKKKRFLWKKMWCEKKDEIIFNKYCNIKWKMRIWYHCDFNMAVKTGK